MQAHHRPAEAISTGVTYASQELALPIFICSGFPSVSLLCLAFSPSSVVFGIRAQRSIGIQHVQWCDRRHRRGTSVHRIFHSVCVRSFRRVVVLLETHICTTIGLSIAARMLVTKIYQVLLKVPCLPADNAHCWRGDHRSIGWLCTPKRRKAQHC